MKFYTKIINYCLMFFEKSHQFYISNLKGWKFLFYFTSIFFPLRSDFEKGFTC